MRCRLLVCCLLVTGCNDQSGTVLDEPIDPTATNPAAADPLSTDRRDARAGGPRRSAGKAGRSGGTPSHTVKDGVSESERTAGVLARCSDGSIILDSWPGEYPQPAPQLDAPLRAEVRTDPCGPTTRGCTVPAGLYHPWATAPDRPEDTVFAVRSQPATYTLLVDHDAGAGALSEGTVVSSLGYLAEGLCLLSASGKTFHGACPADGGEIWKPTHTRSGPDVQLVQVSCTSGAGGWLVIDENFMERAAVKGAKIIGHGELARVP